MSEYPYFPLFTDSYLAETLDLKTDEHGAYLLMLMIAWRRPNCSLPGDVKHIQRLLAGASSDMHGNRANRIIPMLLSRFFYLGNDGDFHQKRLEKERDFARKRSEKQRETAKKRWYKSNDNKDIADATRCIGGNAPTPTPIHTDIKERDTIVSPKKPTATPSYLPNDWIPSDECIAYAIKEGFTHEAINRMSASFRDYWVAASGSKARKRDWNAAWRTWVRNERDRSQRKAGGNVMQASGERVGPLTAAMRKFAAEANQSDDVF